MTKPCFVYTWHDRLLLSITTNGCPSPQNAWLRLAFYGLYFLSCHEQALQLTQVRIQVGAHLAAINVAVSDFF